MNIITNPWLVINTLYICPYLSLSMNWDPGPDNSNLIKSERLVPTKAENKPNTIYSIPISLALVEQVHLISFCIMSIRI